MSAVILILIVRIRVRHHDPGNAITIATDNALSNIEKTVCIKKPSEYTL